MRKNINIMNRLQVFDFLSIGLGLMALSRWLFRSLPPKKNKLSFFNRTAFNLIRHSSFLLWLIFVSFFIRIQDRTIDLIGVSISIIFFLSCWRIYDKPSDVRRVQKIEPRAKL